MPTTFQDVFEKIADAVKDLSSLEVVTYKGTITLQAGATCPAKFDDILSAAKADASFKIIACSQSKLDGDAYFFSDVHASEADLALHQQIVDSANAKRLAVVKLFESAINARLPR